MFDQDTLEWTKIGSGGKILCKKVDFNFLGDVSSEMEIWNSEHEGSENGILSNCDEF